MVQRSMIGAAIAVVAVAAPAFADGFKTPSGNIHCQYFDAPDGAELRCDLISHGPLRRRPAGCDLEWGDAFIVNPGGKPGRLLCHGDTARDDSLPVLAYGASWRQNGLTCKSEPGGLTCVNSGGHGFKLSKAHQEAF